MKVQKIIKVELQMSNFLEALKNRRSIYVLGRNISLSNEEISNLIKEAVNQSPSAFNAQEPRVVILFGENHEKLWNLTEEVLKPLTPEDAFPNTQAKLASFKAGYGTVLFFNNTDTTKNLQEQFALYADNFPDWAEQANGIATSNAWVTLSEAGLGASLQHYNPVIDEAVAKEWNIPTNWRLRSQLVFGSKEDEPLEKDFLAEDERFHIYE